MTKLKFVWFNKSNPDHRGETRWINGDIMSKAEVDDFIARWSLACIGYCFVAERMVIEDARAS